MEHTAEREDNRMNAEEAIKSIDDVLDSDYHYDETLGYELTSDDFEWLEESKKALEKQIPKKPVSYDRHYFKCPACGEDLGKDEDAIYVYQETPPNFCEHCGQKIDWSDTE